MSYILDALRKAERERSLGQPPGAADLNQAQVPASAEPGRARIRQWGIAAALLAVLLAIAIWFWLTPANRPLPPSALPAPEPAAIPAAAAPPVAVEAVAPASAPPAIDETENLTTLDDLADTSAEEAPTDAPAVASSVPAAREDEELAEEIPESAGAAEARAPEPAPDSAVSTSGVPLLRDMPSDFRYSFPAVSIQVHVYDPLPEKRWLLVANKRYAEGTALAEGPKVVEILAEGVIFEHRGAQVLYPLKR